MSLKARLTLLYMSLIGGVAILFSISVYILSGLTLVSQVDQTLQQNAEEIIQITRANSQGTLQAVAELPLGLNVFAQFWSNNGSLQYSSYNLFSYVLPLDRVGLQTSVPVFRDVSILDGHFRVLSVPLEANGRPFGTLQVGADMLVVDGTQQALSTTLAIISVIVVIVGGVVGWGVAQNELSHLEAATEAALQITETNALSRRIPITGRSEDEVGQLVQAFNLNLSRLERLIDSQRRFLTDVGHELRTPLTVIKGNVDLMRRFREFDEEFLIGIEDEVQRLTRLVGDLLLLAQAEAGKLPMYRQIVDLDTVLLEVFRQAKVLSDNKVALKIKEIDQVLVCGDRDRLKQVMLNLISNAIKYTPSGGQVEISLGKNETKAWIAVADNGPGIPEDEIPNIFERFYRAEKSRSRSKDSKKGYGLGLSIAYWIVKNHEGKIDVKSELGKGTTFEVWLPLLADGENCQGDTDNPSGRQI